MWKQIKTLGKLKFKSVIFDQVKYGDNCDIVNKLNKFFIDRM